jgi:hypothetical protein
LPLVVAGLAVARPRSPRFVFGTLASPLALVYLAYTVKVGGDFMGLHRFIMPVFFLAAMGAALGLYAVCRAIPRLWRGPAAVVLCAAVIGAFGVSQARLTARSMKWGNFGNDRGIDTPAFLRVYALDRAAIGVHMRDCFEPDDFSIVGGAGAQPYMGRMRGIDVFGLVSEDIAHNVRPTRPRAGHNKWGPNRLLLKYDPEFVFSCYSIHRDPKRPRFNCPDVGFWLRNGYRRVTLHIPALRQQGQYYTFLVREDRALSCPGIVR